MSSLLVAQGKRSGCRGLGLFDGEMGGPDQPSMGGLLSRLPEELTPRALNKVTRT